MADILARHGFTRPRIFGSVARGEDTPDSDLDLVTDFPLGIGLFDLGRVRDELEAIVQAKVDLVPTEGLRQSVRENIDREAVPL